jgi:hypothetical protein
VKGDGHVVAMGLCRCPVSRLSSEIGIGLSSHCIFSYCIPFPSCPHLHIIMVTTRTGASDAAAEKNRMVVIVTGANRWVSLNRFPMDAAEMFIP